MNLNKLEVPKNHYLGMEFNAELVTIKEALAEANVAAIDRTKLEQIY